MAKIDLVTSVYNRERYLAETIESVLSQTFTDFRYCVWDDASTDQSGGIMQQYATQDHRMVTRQNRSNQGQTAGLKAAIATGAAPYLGWIDSDDLLTMQTLQICNDYLDAHPEVGMVYTHYQEMDEWGKVENLGRRCHIPYSPERMLLDFMTFHFRLMRRSVYEEIGGLDLDYRYAQDYDLCLRLSEATVIHAIAMPLYYYRVHRPTISKRVVSRIEQIDCAQRAVESALKRRGLSAQYQLEVEVYSHFRLKTLIDISTTPPSANMSG